MESQFAKHMSLLNNNQAYQSEVNQATRRQTPVIERQRGMPPGLNIVPKQSITEGEPTNRNSYQPVPDNRFYTKANFFTLRNNSRENVISEQYQTDAEPGEQEVFEEMMHRRNKLASKAGAVVPAVPADYMMSP
jgi:hypothetical protein